MELPIVTTAFAGGLIILQQILMLTVGLRRASVGIGVGTGGDEVLLRKQRRHGNLAENSAILIILVGLLELSGVEQNILFGFAGAFFAGRLAHAIGFSFETGAKSGRFTLATLLRALGAFATSIGGIAGAGYLLFLLSV